MSLAKHNAEATCAGFLYQFERALLWLARSPAGVRVGLETDDDVALQGNDGSRILEQDKHSVSDDGHPFGNRSKGLWNSLSIWADGVHCKEIDPACTRFFMVTNRIVPDCIARKICADNKDIDDCLAALDAAGQEPPQHIADIVQRVLSSDLRKSLRAVVERCEMADGTVSSSGSNLRVQTIQHLQIPDWCLPQADSIVNELLGWMQNSALQNWRGRQPAWIPRERFVNQMHAILDRRKRSLRRERAEHLIPLTDEGVGQHRGRPFVQQLHLVTDDDVLVDVAIREFLRCSIEKSRLSIEGNVTDDDWTAFEAALQSRWEKIRGRVIRMKKDEREEDIGFAILTETTEDYRAKLAGTDTDQVYLTSGTYHRLADLLKLGWHPKFKELMQKLIQT